ncbi:MAG: methionine--tRNA ligase, partial [Microgenomates group bacterium]
HERIVQEILTKIYQKGDIYKARYEGFYCVGCEKFISEDELVDNHCPLHPNKTVEKQSEENWFFRLSKYVPTLIEAIENKNHPYHYEIAPENKKNEVLARLKAGVRDLSISRSEVSWGIAIPWDTSQTIYVWVDALFNYYTATKITGKENFWPADLHLIAKDILWFHTVIWEALLLAANLPLPKKIFIHNFYSVEGQKMSKSLGNVISPQELIEKFGVDGARYLVACSFPAFDDADVSLDKFREKYNADLANGLGNLVSRIASLAKKSETIIGNEEKIDHKDEVFEQKLNELDVSGSLVLVWEKISELNKKINELRLWTKTKEELNKDLPPLIAKLRKIAVLLTPFMPETSQKILDQFKGPTVKNEQLLFPRI